MYLIETLRVVIFYYLQAGGAGFVIALILYIHLLDAGGVLTLNIIIYTKVLLKIILGLILAKRLLQFRLASHIP